MRFEISGAVSHDDLICYDTTECHVLNNVRIRRGHSEQAQRLLNKINKDLSKI